MNSIEAAVREATPDTPGEWVVKLARFGYAAKGIVYVLVGGLTIAAAFLSGQQVTGSEGALLFLALQPFGKVLLVVVGIGLLAFALWRLVQAVKNPQRVGYDLKGRLQRVGLLISGVIYAGLAVTAWTIISTGALSHHGEEVAQSYTARLMSQPFGRWLVGAVGLILLGIALQEFYQSWSGKFMRHIRNYEIKPETRIWIRRVGGLGRAARGLVFVIVGIFILQAAWHYNPGEARGMEGALRALQEQSYGPYILTVVGAGLLGYGLFQFVNARYRAISPNVLD